MHIICTAFSHGQVTCQRPPAHTLPWPVRASQVSMAGNSRKAEEEGRREQRSATVSRRKTKVKCHVYVMLPYSSCSSLFCCLRYCALYFISPFVCLFLFSLFFFVRFAFVRFLFLFVWKYFTYTDISHRALINSQQQDELTQSPLEVPCPSPFPVLPWLSSHTSFYDIYFYDRYLCVPVCAPFAVCKREKQLKY